MEDNNKQEQPRSPDRTQDAEDLTSAELLHINKGRQAPAGHASDYRALACSGGGIRSASFGLGIMQALAADNKLQHFDYLSSVSGGGYLSSSLTWYLSQRDPQTNQPFNCSDKFPFGKKNVGNKTGQNSLVNNILNYIRLHGNYLIPGKGLDMLSFIATVLRVVVSSFLVYSSLLILMLILVMQAISMLPAVHGHNMNFLIVFGGLALLAAGIFVIASLVFSLRTVRGVHAYRMDVDIQRLLGYLLKAFAGFVILCLLPVIKEILGALLNHFVDPASTRPFLVNGSVALSSYMVGAILGFLSHRRAFTGNEEVSGLQISLSAFFLLFGMLFGSYCVAELLLPWMNWWTYPIMAALVVAPALLCNVNLFGLNRMYRNRLMETFMQAPDQINRGIWEAATAANQALVARMCQQPNNRPYHLINCNIVLADSDRADFRGRKGDSFLISPLYCGSDATGWQRTSLWSTRGGRAGMTLATAMAISGAAANPDAGVSGQGPTTDKLVSLVMSLLNMRLGFWAENPGHSSQLLPPNYLFPGLQAVALLNKGLTEHQHFVELSDGGHFENLAVYELLRRRLTLIFVSDAGADGSYDFSDLANALEKARVDFGINIEFDADYSLEQVIPGSDQEQSAATLKDYQLARRGFASAKIHYPEVGNKAAFIGYLVYIKPTLIPDLGMDVLSYRRQNSTFPHQSTLDQFFDEVQFEAYRELGYRIGMALVQEINDANCEGGNEILQQVRGLLS